MLKHFPYPELCAPDIAEADEFHGHDCGCGCTGEEPAHAEPCEKEVIVIREYIDSTLAAIEKTVNVDEDAPVEGESVYNLPTDWQGKPLSVYRNGFRYTKYTRTTTGIALLAGDVFGDQEEFVFSNHR